MALTIDSSRKFEASIMCSVEDMHQAAKTISFIIEVHDLFDARQTSFLTGCFLPQSAHSDNLFVVTNFQTIGTSSLSSKISADRQISMQFPKLKSL